MQSLPSLRINFSNLENVLVNKFTTIYDYCRDNDQRNSKLLARIIQLEQNMAMLEKEAKQNLAKLDHKLNTKLDTKQIRTVKEVQVDNRSPIAQDTNLKSADIVMSVKAPGSKPELLSQKLVQPKTQVKQTQLVKMKPQDIKVQKQTHQQEELVSSPNVDTPMLHQNYTKLVEKRLDQLNKKIQEVEFNLKGNQQTSHKKFSQLAAESEQNYVMLNKYTKISDQCSRKIDELADDLSDFKLKKELKYNQIVSSITPQNPKSGSDQTFKKMVIQKMRLMSRDIRDCVKGSDLELFKQQLNKNIKLIYLELEGKLNLSIYEVFARTVEEKMNEKNQLPNNQNLENRVVQPQQITISTDLESIKHRLMQCQSKQAIMENSTANILKEQTNFNQKLADFENRIVDLQESFKNYLDQFNRTYEKKIQELEGQIYEQKEKIEKQEKLRDFKSGSTSVNESTDYIPNKQDRKEMKMELQIEIQNQIQNQNKKISKVILKMSQQKEELIKFLEQIRNQLESHKADIERKIDIDTVKKNFSFIENKINQIVNNMSLNEVPKDASIEDSLAAKKSWTCLCCDKNIEKYQAKVSDFKFGSIFPTRFQSPRIGGYYKQKQQDKEYKKVYLSPGQRKAEGLPSVSTSINKI